MRLESDFPTTSWTLVDAVGAEDAEGGREKLKDLFERYAPAMRAYLLRFIDAQEADDLLQAFFVERIIDGALIKRADKARGSRFRHLLKKAIKNFVIDHLRRAGRQPRSASEDNREPATDQGPAQVLDYQWARLVVGRALRRTERECRRKGRDDLWGVLQQRVVRPALDGEPPAPYERLIEEHRFASPSAVYSALRTAKNMYIRNLRCVIGEYAASEAEVNDEIDELFSLLAHARSE